MLRRVHLIFKTHLDVGFTDLAHSVVANYFQHYLPRAMALAEEFRQAGGPERFVWTTGSWLIYEYLEQASSAERARMENAIAAGDLAWHGLPFTTHSELMDADLFRFGLSLSQELDRRFGKHTLAAKMTDVPGHTRGIVPLLAEAGIQFLHIGVNPCSTAPDVPPVFVWRDSSSAEVTVMYTKGSYGEAMPSPGRDEVIWFAHTSDNLGPQSAREVRDIFKSAREQFPGAEIIASTMDAFALALARIKDQLPIVTEELGDTWIHGVGTDPHKVSQFRELLRLRRQWLKAGTAAIYDAPFARFSRCLLMIPEHTWGLDVKTHLGDFSRYAADDFCAARSEPNFRKLESSWAEQRDYLQQAAQALGASRLADEATAALRKIEPTWPDTSGFESISDLRLPFETAHFHVGFDERGALTRLTHRVNVREWASADHPLGLFCYQTFSSADYARFYRQYIINKPQNEEWAVPDFTKPGLTPSEAASQDWLPRLKRLFHKQDVRGHSFILFLSTPEKASARYGCPQDVTVEIELPDDSPVAFFNLQWFNKPACRLPEAIWLTIAPLVKRSGRWTMDKLGTWISPREVIRDGNRKLHAVGTGVAYRERHAGLFLETLDAPLVAPGERTLLNFNNRQPPLGRGMHFLLCNNVWGTNFPMWYDQDARFRFVLRPE